MREEKNRKIMFREHMNPYETKPNSTMQQHFVQDTVIRGMNHTRTVMYDRNVFNKGRFVTPHSLSDLR
jgi:hypothetical protein